MSEFDSIHAILVHIQTNLVVGKGQLNKFGGYKYRSLEDIKQAVKPLLAEANATLTFTDEPIMIGDWHYLCSTATLEGAGGTFSTKGYAREVEALKGQIPAQITGGCSSYAGKYAVCGMFGIDDNDDPDSRDNSQDEKPAKKNALSLLKAAKTLPALAAAWERLSPAQHQQIGREQLDTLKAKLGEKE